MTPISILTGDIVDSTSLAPEVLDSLMKTLENSTGEMSGWVTGGLTTAFARRGGDGWQVALGKGPLALRAALYIQASLRSQGEDKATRIAAATGAGQIPADKDLNSAHGAVFNASGRLLEDLQGNVLMAHAAGGALDAAFVLADHISQGWTPAQARAVQTMLRLNDAPRREAAAALGISRQAVDQALKAAGYPALIAAVSAIEAPPTGDTP